MDGPRGATGAVDVGVSHLNMNINVTAGGLGAVGIPGGAASGSGDATGATSGLAGGVDSVASSSPPVRGCSCR